MHVAFGTFSHAMVAFHTAGHDWNIKYASRDHTLPNVAVPGRNCNVYLIKFALNSVCVRKF